ncbi:MAG: DUF5050 domain-containing protein [bacterium]
MNLKLMSFIGVFICIAGVIFADNNAALPTAVEKLLPEKCKVVAACIADLNGDNKDDYLIVIQLKQDQNDEGQDTNPESDKELMVIVEKDNNYVVAAITRRAILCSSCGGVWGDPFESIEAGKKFFVINHYGGSREKWSISTRFAYSHRDNKWQLVKYESSYYDTGDESSKVQGETLTPKRFGLINLEDYDINYYLDTKKMKPRPQGDIKDWIVFASDDGKGVNVYMMNSNGTLLRKMTDILEGGGDTPSWSRDHGKIAFCRTRDVIAQIGVMNSDGTGIKELTHDNLQKVNPAWSPDGKKIAYGAYKDGEKIKIYVIDADGKNLKRLTNNSASDFGPSWSPDGSKIVFTRATGINGESGKIFTIDADGGNEKHLTKGSDKENDICAVYSPNGIKIYFTRNFEFYTMNPDGTGQKSLKCKKTGLSQVWSPNGKYIIFTANGEKGSIWEMTSDGTIKANLTDQVKLENANNYSPSWK